MKQKLLLALLALFTLGWTNASAQSWQAKEVAAGNYHLYNVGKGQFLTRGNGWQTQASTGANALTLIVEEYDGAYKLRTNVNGDGKGLERLSDPVIYTDQSAGKNSTWTFTKVADASNGPVYTIVSAENHGGGAGSYMTANADNTIVGPADAVTDDYGRWQLFQSWITNTMPVTNTDGWTVSQDPTFDAGNICAEFWNKSGASIKQTLLNLPAGSYELIAVALTREGMTATLNAGSNTMSIATASNTVVDNRAQAKTWFDNGNGVNRLEFTHAGGSLEIGLTADNANGDHWLVWRSFVLLYKGLDLSEFAATLAAAVEAAEAVEGTVPAAAYNALATVVTEHNKDYATAAEYTAAAEAIVAATNAAKALQANYARYNAIKTSAKAIATSLDTTIPDAAVEEATTNDDIDAAIPTLRANFLTELPNVTIPTDPGYIDVTAVMVDNASVRQNTDYWTIEGTPNTSFSWGKCANNECEFYNQNFKFYQTLALTPGTWEFGVTGFHRGGQGEFNTDFYAGVDKISIPGVESSVVNTMAQAEAYFDNGNGKVALKFLIEEAGNVEIGINNQDTQTDKWTIFRDFTLKYYGAPDYSVYDTQWEEAVAAANAAIDANPNVTGEELSAVRTAISDAPDGSSKANYLEKINALTEATATLIAAAPAYNAYAAEKAIAEMIGVTPGEDPTTSAAAAAGVNNLKVAEFNYVKTEYPYDYQGVIGDFGTWTGTATVAGQPAEPNHLSNEHWSGQTHAYYEQAANGWGNAGGWTIKYEKTAKLPAGDYMLKVAARSSVDVTSLISCSATENTVTLPKAGNRTRGINTSGVASWSDSDTFIFGDPDDINVITPAVGGRGGGWEWRFLPFSLTEETEVTMTFYAETNMQYNWMSIADGTLLSKQEIQNEVELTDADEAAPEAQVATSVITDRKLLEGLNTVIFPFETTATELGATTVLAYTGTTEEADGLTLNFKEVAPVDGKITLQANTPYAVMVDADQTENLAFGTKNISPSGELTVTDANNEFNFVGTYTNLAKGNKVVVEGDYVAGATAFKKAKGGNRIAAYRAYLKKVGTSNVANVKFNFGGDVVDGIEALELLNKFSADGIFNLQGQKVNNAQKGVYIVNGKKIVVK